MLAMRVTIKVTIGVLGFGKSTYPYSISIYGLEGVPI